MNTQLPFMQQVIEKGKEIDKKREDNAKVVVKNLIKNTTEVRNLQKLTFELYQVSDLTQLMNKLVGKNV